MWKCALCIRLQSIFDNYFKCSAIILYEGKNNLAADILDNLIVLKVNKTTCEEVLEELSNAAIKAGYAKPGYHKAILEREAKYPTGLHIPLIEVAIPHADAEWAIKPSLTIGILETPVAFGSMDGSGGDVMAGLVFMLTIEEPKDHIDFLQGILKCDGAAGDPGGICAHSQPGVDPGKDPS